MAVYTRGIYKGDILQVIRPTNFHEVGEIVLCEGRSFAPFIKIRGKPGHYGDESFKIVARLVK